MSDASDLPERGSNGQRSNPPALNLPAAVTAAIVIILAVYVLGAYVLSADARDTMFFYGGFIPARYNYPLSEQGLEWLWTPLTYSFLHGGVEHLGFNALWLAAFGAPVVRRIGTARFVVFWVVSSVASAALYLGLHWNEASLLIGASGVISALMGAACRFAFPPDHRRRAREVHLYPRLSIGDSLRSRTVAMFMLMWFIGNVIFALGIPLLGDIGNVAWEAHIGGFLFGFLLFALFDPMQR
ncbi:rhomboid family intramembrane serine protease [Rhizobium sp. LjRoot30]|uniref:rhomboid family intramembrane serine protease n=1 Tax=Rhizobium sp. LjRoot30 TaxID=3342320 RepID=UPI003ECC8033